MGTFYGIFNTDSGPINPEAAGRMHAAMNHWNADKSGVYEADGIMLGNLMLFVSPRDRKELLPFSIDRYTISGDIRLDNREEILNRLGTGFNSDPERPDSQLILELYARYGSGMLSYLVGDFAFCIWNNRDKSLFCARDHLGVRPFYYYYKDRLFAFASEKNGILGIPGIDRSIDEEYFLRILGDIDTPRDQTFFKYIRQIPSGCWLKVDPSGSSEGSYWKIQMPAILRLRDSREYLDGFRDMFNRSVQSRIQTEYPIGVELSGGLDSTGVLGAASRQISDKSRLHTFSNISPVDELGKKLVTDEEEWIDEVIRFNGISNVHKIKSGGWSDIFEPLDLELKVHGSPIDYPGAWLEPVRRVMEDQGIRVSLSGYLGDEFITHPGATYFYDIFFEGEYTAFVRACFREKLPFLPMKMFLRSLIAKFGVKMFPFDKRMSYINNSFLSDSELERKLRNDTREVFRQSVPSRSHKERITQIISRTRISYRFQSEAGYSISHKMVTRYPLADIRLMQYFLSIPAKFMGDTGLTRAFYRHAMEGYIPDSVRMRMDKSVPASPFSTVEAGSKAAQYRSWLVNNKDIFLKGPLSYASYPEIVKRFDPELPENYKEGLLLPWVQFNILTMIRFLEKKAVLERYKDY